jgi:hypothetical protein
MTPIRLAPFALGLAVALAVAVSAPAQEKAATIVGDWQGSLSLGKRTLTLALHVTPAPEGLPNASLVDLQQGGEGLPGRIIEQSGATSQVLFLDAGADYTATVSADGQTLTGKWNQGALSLPLVMTRTAPAAPARKN